MSGRGVHTRPAETLLAERALDFLAGGPADAVTLVEHICQLPGAPPAVAEQMAAAILADRREFAHDPDGRWRLASAAPVATWTASPTPPLTFDEWRARRIAERLNFEQAEQAAHPRRPSMAEQAPELTSAVAREPLASLSFAVVDVETTGGRPSAGDRITEVAAVIVRGGEIVDVFETLVNPQRSIPRFITALTNISWDMVKDKPTFGEICPRLLGVLEGHVFVAHNVSFDWRFVAAEVSRATGRRLDGRRLCTVRLARKLLPHLPRRSLDYVTRHYGIDNDARHRAAGDAIATARVLTRLLSDAGERGCSTWAELDRLLSAPSGRARRGRRRLSGLPAPVDRDTTA